MFWMKNKKVMFLLRTLNKNFQRKIVNIFLPIILAYDILCFGCSKRTVSMSDSFEHMIFYVLGAQKEPFQ